MVRGRRCEGAGGQQRSKEIEFQKTNIGKSYLQQSHLLAQLEDGQASGGDEGEERELKGVPGLETQHAQSQRDQGHGLQEDEHHDGDKDLLQLGLAGLNGTAGGSKVNLEVHLVSLHGGCVGDGGIGGRNLEFDVAALDEVLQLGSQVIRSSRDHVVGSSIAGHFDVIENLDKKYYKKLLEIREET